MGGPRPDAMPDGVYLCVSCGISSLTLSVFGGNKTKNTAIKTNKLKISLNILLKRNICSA